MEGLQPDQVLYLKALENITGYGTHDLTVNMMPRTECVKLIANVNTMETVLFVAFMIMAALTIYFVLSNPRLNKALKK